MKTEKIGYFSRPPLTLLKTYCVVFTLNLDDFNKIDSFSHLILGSFLGFSACEGQYN